MLHEFTLLGAGLLYDIHAEICCVILVITYDAKLRALELKDSIVPNGDDALSAKSPWAGG